MTSPLLLLALAIALATHSVSAARIHLRTGKHRVAKGAPSADSGQRHASFSYTEHYFQQTLDHFNVGNVSLFSQRYLMNNRSWSGAASQGPIFVYCGNEGDIVWFAENTGFLFDTAPQFGALLVFPEHRFYGQSQPFGNRKGPDALAFLTAEQALADFATLILDLKKNLSAEASPVVVFGGSYGGMLAAWFRLKYPHVALGALASSAPILQFEDLVPTDTFYNIVSNDFKGEGEACFEHIRSSWSAIEKLAEQPGGLHSLSLNFHMCKDLKSVDDLIDWLESAYSYLAMVDYPFAADFMMPLPAYPIREVCKNIVESSHGTDIFQRIYAGANVYYNYTGNVKCNNLDDDPHGLNLWNWQACTEMVMPMSSNPNTSMFRPFSWDGKAFADSCMESYGATPRSDWITTEFGGHDIKFVLRNYASNIVFSNGLLDPWSGGSVLYNISDTIVAFVTEEGAHHLDLRWASNVDPEWLIEQRNSEVREIKRWLSKYYEAHTKSEASHNYM